MPELWRRTRVTLSVVISCFNEEHTPGTCLQRMIALHSDDLELEVVVVDHCSRDRSPAIVREFASRYPDVWVLRHDRSLRNGAALRTAFRKTFGDLVAVAVSSN